MNNERDLTPQEQARKEQFEAVRTQLEQQGYVPRDLTVSVLQGNTLGVLCALPFVVLLVVAFVLWSDHSRWGYGLLENSLLVVLMLAGIVVHELIHGLTWGIFAKNHFRVIAFGVIWKQLTPYCTCGEALSRAHYILGVAMPTLILGFLCGAISVLTGNVLLCIFAAVMIIGGGGDLLIVLKICTFRSEKTDQLYYDHPYELGLVVFER